MMSHPTCVWLSAAVEKTWDFLVGMVVLRLIMRVNTPPRVSMPEAWSSSSTTGELAQRYTGSQCLKHGAAVQQG
jgi:hypothetical protein